MAVPDIVGKFAFLIIQILVCCLVIAGIVMFARSITCSDSPANMYEHFESSADATVSAMKKRTEQLRALKERIQSDMDNLNESSDDICNILKEVEDSYVSNSMAPTDETEYSLPADIQSQRKAERKRRALLRFKEEQKLYGTIYKKPILECFYADGADVAAAEAELIVEVDNMRALLDTAEIKMSATRLEKTRGLMGFTGQQLKKVVDTMTSKPTEGWADVPAADDLRGAKLIAEADRLLGIATTFHKEINQLRQEVLVQKDTAGQIKQKQKALSNGQMTESDKAAGIAAAQQGR